MSIEKLTKRLQGSIDFALDNEEDLDDASWNYQKGILITANETKLLLDIVKNCSIPDVMRWVATTDSLPTAGSYVWAAKIGDEKSKLIKWGTGDESFYDVWQHATAPKPPCA